MRLLATADHNALDIDRVRITYLIRFDFRIRDEGGNLVPAPLYFTTDAHTREHAGIEWLGAGAMLEMSLPQEDSSMEAHACQVAMSGLDPSIISLALNERLEGSEVIIWCLLTDPDTNQPVAPPWIYHRGSVSQVEITPPTIVQQHNGDQS